jgi:hypothetical protein
MPIEVRELLIRANIHEGDRTPSPTPASDDTVCASNEDKRALVRECAELVMEMLQQRSGR